MPYLAGRYKYTNVLARGQSAIIIKVLDTFHNDKPLAIKVLHRVYKPIGSQEADILLELHRADPWLHVPFARLLNQFLYGPHYCLVFEYLSPTPLYNHYDQREIRETSALPHIRDLTVKLLTVLGFLYKQNVIHADLKPENILLSNEEDLSSIMVVDFGNALRNTDEELSLYYSDFELQTLLYRAPEVMFGMKFSLEVDMWSLGCLLAECYLGEPLFMGKSKKEILSKITALMGPFPREFNDGEYSKEFADYVGRPMSRYQRLENLRKRLNDCKDSTFLMLVERLLTYLPDRRFTPFEAACHPFVACSTPFLYLTPSPGYIRYPTILLDMSTYPYLPGLPDDEDENSASALSRKRLASFARYKRPPQASQASSQGQKEKESSGPAVPNAVSGAPPAAGARKDGVDALKTQSIPKPGSNMVVQPGGKTATRSDVKETLKSMGLRCEDFTISVYSREQAHAILRRQGVEVTPNNLPSKEKLVSMAAKGGYKNARSGEMQRPPHNMRPLPPTNTRKVVPRYDDDDDDCVILDPPDMPKPQPPVSLPQQFQLMGTTVQVNRGAKRPNRPMMNQPLAKRPNARPMQYYHKEHEEYGAEASVQDTLKRLKNYNISITCRRNASGLGPRGPMDSDSDLDNEGHMDSDEEEEDMTKYLECQIGEIDDLPEQEIYEDDVEVDCDDKDDVDYNPRGKKKKKNKSPRKGRRSVDPTTMLEQSMPESEMEIPELDSSIEMKDTNDLDNSIELEKEEKSDSISQEESKKNDNVEEMESLIKNTEHPEEEEKDENAEDNILNADEDKLNSSDDKLDTDDDKLNADDEMNADNEEESEKLEEPSQEEEEEEEKDAVQEEGKEEQTKEDGIDNVEDNINEEMEEHLDHEGPEEVEEDPEEVDQLPPREEEEEIDDELEKELLAGEVGDGEDMGDEEEEEEL